jgi:penicillin-binding protein 1C
MVAAILRARPAPPGVAADPQHPIAYKTGTSYGFRDAWAAGFTPAHTIVVWVGRPDNTPRPGATGRDVAAPLLFRLFALLPPEAPVTDLVERVSPSDLAPALSRRTPQAALRILFPPGNVDLAFDPSSPIDLHAAGGSPPYRWLADGIPLQRRPGDAVWTPSGPGFAHLTVTDREGQYASTDVRVVTE